MRYAVLTVSDRCAAGEATDEAGPALCKMMEGSLDARQVAVRIVPDDVEAIRGQLTKWSSMEDAPEVILTTGGTGLGPRDVTPEATRAVLDRIHPGLMEMSRDVGAESTPLAYLSRGVAGTIGASLVINLPGSTTGATDSLRALVPVLAHAVASMKGGGHGRPYDE
ncbi:MAG: MogA/MoaB family molybdenum cofactor biosynthesis protein [Acidimicrobiia bacterium]|nr:MogA/MoaB family molybdenum cofactor biosynthesis protein [Acidimicrobiia bacterium]